MYQLGKLISRGGQLFRSRWQSMQIVGGPTDQGPHVGRCGGDKLAGRQLSVDEQVNRVVLARKLWFLHRLERPMGGCFLFDGCGNGLSLPGIDCSLADPGFQVPNLAGRQLFLGIRGRHT